MMINDRQITISAAGSRTATHWPAQTLQLSELWQRLATPTRSTESHAEYMSLSKSKQDTLKDVGGFVGGTLQDGRRKGNAVLGRDLVVLDLDRIAPGGTQEVLRRVDALSCGYCVYSTRKHAPAAPRLRILLPLDRTVTADEYEPVSRRMAEYIGIEMADPSTFEACRLMYWPSCCADGEYIYTFADKPLLSADGLLATYAEWRDATSWPQVPGAEEVGRRLAAKQADPEGKEGVVGSFCRVYSVYRAMDELLLGIYDPVDTASDRYTFTGGSTTGGAVVYDNGKFLYSHHATDPAGGKLCNAFDLVRLHLYGDKDDDAKPGTPTNRLPSFEAMCRMAEHLPDVSALIAREIYARATSDFAGTSLNTDGDTDPANWMQQLETRDGRVDKTINNMWIILENDPLLKDKFALNEFASRGEVFGKLPWNENENRRFWEDNDNQGVYWHMEKVYQITGVAKIDGALSLHSTKHAFNEIKDYLSGLTWDGVERLDKLFIDYLGAVDSPYTRAVTRKAFTAAVARAMTPGMKFDIMTVISGPQGIGKSTLLQMMGRGWFTDSLRTFEGKDPSELVQGVWIVEVSELDALRRSDVNRVKQFLSQQVDRFRAAYGRHVKDCPRRCIFFGTSNSREYLQDSTGNRRFWPVDAAVITPQKNVWEELPFEVDQLWAEAVLRWRLGEPLYLSGEVEECAKQEQENHREQSPHEGVIRDFLEAKVPRDWSKWDLSRRGAFLSGNSSGIEAEELVDRDKVCALEVWCEALGNDFRYMKRPDATEINNVIASTPGWNRMKKTAKFGYCKTQRGFERR